MLKRLLPLFIQRQIDLVIYGLMSFTQGLTSYFNQLYTGFCPHSCFLHFTSVRKPMRMSHIGLPHFAVGKIIKGFGRGSKELGIPTANFDDTVVKELPESITTGIYFGWAQVRNNVYKMVISIGWNPFYNNERKSMETHIMHKFDNDLYDETMKIAIVGYLRPEKNFEGVIELITAIKQDISDADNLLDQDKYSKFKTHEYFQ